MEEAGTQPACNVAWSESPDIRLTPRGWTPDRVTTTWADDTGFAVLFGAGGQLFVEHLWPDGARKTNPITIFSGPPETQPWIQLVRTGDHATLLLLRSVKGAYVATLATLSSDDKLSAETPVAFAGTLIATDEGAAIVGSFKGSNGVVIQRVDMLGKPTGAAFTFPIGAPAGLSAPLSASFTDGKLAIFTQTAIDADQPWLADIFLVDGAATKVLAHRSLSLGRVPTVDVRAHADGFTVRVLEATYSSFDRLRVLELDASLADQGLPLDVPLVPPGYEDFTPAFGVDDVVYVSEIGNGSAIVHVAADGSSTSTPLDDDADVHGAAAVWTGREFSIAWVRTKSGPTSFAVEHTRFGPCAAGPADTSVGCVSATSTPGTFACGTDGLTCARGEEICALGSTTTAGGAQCVKNAPACDPSCGWVAETGTACGTGPILGCNATAVGELTVDCWTK